MAQFQYQGIEAWKIREISRNEYRTRSYATKGIRAGGCNEASRPRKNGSLWSRYIAFVED